MKKTISVLLLATTLFSFSGCATWPLEKGPSLSALTQYRAGKNIAMVIVDDRGGDAVGRIGLIKAKVNSTSMKNLLANQLMYELNEREQVNFLQFQEVAPEVLLKNNPQVDGVLSVHVHSIKASTIDVLIPVRSEMSAEVVFFDKTGDVRIRKNFDVASPEGIVPITPAKEKAVVGSVIDELVHAIVIDYEIKQWI